MFWIVGCTVPLRAYTSGFSKLMSQSTQSSFVNKLFFLEQNRLCTELRDKPIHQCHNLFLSSPCSLIKTLFEVTTLLHAGITPPSRQLDMLPVCSLSVFLAPSVCLCRPLLLFFPSCCPSFPPSSDSWMESSSNPVGGKPTPQDPVCHL